MLILYWSSATDPHPITYSFRLQLNSHQVPEACVCMYAYCMSPDAWRRETARQTTRGQAGRLSPHRWRQRWIVCEGKYKVGMRNKTRSRRPWRMLAPKKRHTTRITPPTWFGRLRLVTRNSSTDDPGTGRSSHSDSLPNASAVSG